MKCTAKNNLVSTVFLADSQPLWNSLECEVPFKTIPERVQEIDPMVTVSKILLQVK
jgi:hypothetical protein